MRHLIEALLRFLTPLLPLLLALGAKAQLLTNNGAVLTSTAAIQVNGGLTNQSGGLLLNDGTITLTGDLLHHAANTCFGATQGTVVMNGAAQAIGGSSVAVFNNLTLAGSGNKTLQQHAEVGGAYAAPAGVIALNDRILDLNGYDLTVRNAAPSAITRTTGYVVSERDPVMGYSRLRWNIGAGAAGNAYEFPFGNPATGHYLPVTAMISTAGSGASGAIALATYPTSTAPSPNNRPLPSGLPSLIDLAGNENAAHVLDRWWVMEATGFAIAPSANLLFTYRDAEWSTGTNTIVESGLQLERFAGTWSMVPTVTSIGANTLSASAVPLQPGIWTAAEQLAPLPVELLAFSAARIDDRAVVLEWTTATELNNAGFELWRMIEGEDGFKPIGWVGGRGTTQQLTRYAHEDDNASAALSYYKLKQVDTDGGFTWSDAVAVEGARAARSIVLFPNPADQWITISGLAEAGVVRLLDASGRLVREERIAVGAASVQLETGALVPGAYTVQVMADAGGSPATARLIIAH